MALSKPKYLPMVPPPNTITLGLRASTFAFWKGAGAHENIWSVTQYKLEDWDFCLFLFTDIVPTSTIVPGI